MTKTKFTPGPWFWDIEEGSNKVFLESSSLENSAGSTIVSATYDGLLMVDHANANLIAAAPDLYEALSALFDVKVTHLSVDSLMRIQPHALEALAKARGEHD